MSKATQRFYPSRSGVTLTSAATRSNVEMAEQEVWRAMKNLSQFQREALISRVSAKVRQDREGGVA
ncbi:MAG: hypothetical protein AAF773_05150 [Cyanobacteria bacterium P01_D01_bin.115]